MAAFITKAEVKEVAVAVVIIWEWVMVAATVVAVVGAEGMEVVDEVGEIVMAGEEGEDTKEVEAPFPGRILEEEVDLHQELQGVAD